jgi:hypothetical protein
MGGCTYMADKTKIIVSLCDSILLRLITYSSSSFCQFFLQMFTNTSRDTIFGQAVASIFVFYPVMRDDARKRIIFEFFSKNDQDSIFYDMQD